MDRESLDLRPDVSRPPTGRLSTSDRTSPTSDRWSPDLRPVVSRPPTGRLRPPTGGLRPPTGRLRPPTGRLRTSDRTSPTSDRTSLDLRPDVSDLRPDVSDLRPDVSDLRPGVSPPPTGRLGPPTGGLTTTDRWSHDHDRDPMEGPRAQRRRRSAGWAPAAPAGRRPRTGGHPSLPAWSLVTGRALADPMKHPAISSRSRVGRESALAEGRV
jgi:hypothetical protein